MKLIELPAGTYNAVATVQPTPWPTNPAPADQMIRLPAGQMEFCVGNVAGTDCWVGGPYSHPINSNGEPVTDWSRGEWRVGQLRINPDPEKDYYGVWETGFQPGSPWAAFGWKQVEPEKRVVVAELEAGRDTYVGTWVNRLVTSTTTITETAPPSITVEAGEATGSNPLHGAKIIGRITATGFDLPVVEGFVDSGELILARQAITHWRNNSRGVEVFAVHASEVNLTDLAIGDEIKVDYQPYQVVSRQVVSAGSLDLNSAGSAGQKVLVSCVGEVGNWHSRILLFLDPVVTDLHNLPE